jgi:hypothetical protein
MEGKGSMVGRNPSLWTSYGRYGRMERSGHASSPESIWPARTRLAKRDQERWLLSQKTVNPCPRPGRQHGKEHQILRAMVFSVS